MTSNCVAEPDQSPPHVVQDPPTNETAELAIDYDFVEQPDQDYFRKARQFKVYCPHKKNGCEWTGKLGDQNHHTTSCPKRPWKCQYCDHESIYESGPTDHTPNCTNYPLPCPNQCEIGTVPCCQAVSHLLECPLQLVECEFAGTGCDVKVPRRDLAGHMTESAQHHLMTATLLNLRLTRELHKKMEEKNPQIVELKQQLTEQETKMITDFDTKLQQQTKDLNTKLQQQTKDLNTKRQQQTKDLDTKRQQQTKDLDTKFQQQTKDLDTKLQQQSQLIKALTFTCHTHTLTGFNRCQAKGGDACSWYSEPFYNCPGEYKFKLNIDTNGQGGARGTHISPFLYLFKGDCDEQLCWPLKLTVILDMLNQEEDHGHHSVITVMEFNKAASASTPDYKCIGNSTYKFYPLAQLKEKNYLRNNEIKFRLWLKVM